MPWGKAQITKQAYRTAREDYAAFEAVNLAGRAGVRVLDVGCFDGFNTVLKFAPYAGIERVVGIDPDAAAVAEAVARTDDARFAFQCCAFKDYEPAEGERFDLVYFSHVLQHVADPQAALAKAYRLLAPGGFVVVKTIDDGVKVSYPDPDDVMCRLFALYERHVLPNTPHTAHTDRSNGRKCYTLMRRAGFENVRVRTFAVATAGKTPDERHALFERCVYFRRVVPPCVSEVVADEIHALVDAWEALFAQEDYYFSSQSFVVIGQKPALGEEPWMYAGPVFGEGVAAVPAACDATGSDGGVVVRPLTEDDLGAVMGIEVASFRDAWTPLAFGLDVRHNPCARYSVAVVEGQVAGYLGWWSTPEGAAIVRVAVDPARRGAGVGRILVEQAARRARKEGADVLTLEVRESNAGARAFYERLGFQEVARRANFYDDPPEDAVLMALPLGADKGLED